MRISGEFGVQLLGFQGSWAGDSNLRNIDKELILNSLATDEDGKTIFAAIREGETRTNNLAVDFHRESDAVADRDVAGGIANLLDAKIIDSNYFPGIERVLGSQEGEFELTSGVDSEIAGPEAGGISPSIDFGGDFGNPRDGDEGVITDDGEIFL